MNDRLHWSKANELRKLWQDSAFWIAKQNRIAPFEVFPVEVTVVFTTKQPNRRRDPHNFFPTVKHLIDGLTLAGLWPDDDSTHVTTREPLFVEGDGRSYQIILRSEVAT
jgi:crossover junction endodeoxyribonuclease RusA